MCIRDRYGLESRRLINAFVCEELEDEQYWKVWKLLSAYGLSLIHIFSIIFNSIFSDFFSIIADISLSYFIVFSVFSICFLYFFF